MAFIDSQYSQAISLEVVSDRYHMNSAYFSRLFKRYVGMTFTDYLISVRMKAAIMLLEEGGYKIYEISQMVGYTSEKYFF